jgi:hypothetical protein
MVTPDLAKRLEADIDSLSQQFHEHQAIFHDDVLGGMEGRGYVAAEDAATAKRRERREAVEALDPAKIKDLYEALGRLDASKDVAEVMRILDKLSAETGISHEVLVQQAELRHGGDAGQGRDSPAAKRRMELTTERIDAVRAELDLRKRVPILKRLAAELNMTGAQLEAKIEAEVAQMLAERKVKDAKKPAPKAADLGVDTSGAPEVDIAGMESLRAEKFRLAEEQIEKIGKELNKALDMKKGPERSSKELEIVTQMHEALRKAGVEPSGKVLDEALVYVLAEARDRDVKGRRTQAKQLVYALRGDKTFERMQFEGFVLDSVLAENIQAMNELRAEVAALNPDMIFGVREGGAVLLEVLAEPGKPLQEGRQKIVDKRADGNRIEMLDKEIRQAINDPKNPKKSFAIVDSYMGGVAAREFMAMFRQIIADHRHIEGLHLELVWLREKHGFERLKADTKPGDPQRVILEPRREIPEDLVDVIDHEMREVRVVLGDDMDIVYSPNAQDPIRIFDAEGNIVQTIRPPTRHPETQEMLDSTRKIMIALMQGTKFP